jgi:hypothetical protein
MLAAGIAAPAQLEVASGKECAKGILEAEAAPAAELARFGPVHNQCEGGEDDPGIEIMMGRCCRSFSITGSS